MSPANWFFVVDVVTVCVGVERIENPEHERHRRTRSRPSRGVSHTYFMPVVAISSKMLIGTDDAIMYYYNSHTIDNTNPDGFLPADLKRLARFN